MFRSAPGNRAVVIPPCEKLKIRVVVHFLTPFISFLPLSSIRFDQMRIR